MYVLSKYREAYPLRMRRGSATHPLIKGRRGFTVSKAEERRGTWRPDARPVRVFSL